ncbi:putative lipid II flippase FtsW [Bacillus smithii]|uniref:putative lipid II flippase FtsW n=1 Tax=Bacillus smithii TaxID=1479 RepID=UPI0022E1C1E9|nr:putative lipid II flippase FtsW [Bacillus smithii]MED0660088.1 putative lipid II flippase FtsW [Bacillus smithii]MED1419164.1 putative lipid II flippase FtsW [Bacillus smithii]MED1456325.1 putative lipid II flippase FtsW [Bacillus smithii]
MFKKILKSFDYSLIIVYIILSLFGLVMVYSASSVTAVQRYGVPSDYFYSKQKLHIMVAFLLFAIMAFFPYKALKNSKFLFSMIATITAGLVLIFFFGHVSNNAQSWFRVGSNSLQPAEFAKLAVIIYMSAVYAKKQKYINSFDKGVIPPIILLIFICLLIALQPDFGTAFIIFMIGATVILTSGMKFKNIGKLILLGLVISLLLSPVVLLKKDKIFTPEKMGRVEGFLDPFKQKSDQGYQLVNSYLAIGSGGIKGLGLGQSVQKLGYLPEPHTDFIMAVIAEELGLAGVVIVLGGIAFLVLRGIYTGIQCRDPFGSMLAVGISSMIAIQSFINLGGILGLIPITGVPLPFISYGGSSLILLALSMGILVNISMFNYYEKHFKK